MSLACPACGTVAAAPFHVGEPVPVSSCLLLGSRDEAAGIATGGLALACCESCAFIWNTSFVEGRTTYSPDYEESQAFSPTFRRFMSELAREWVDRHGLAGGAVIEIGCGKGEFLDELVRAGVGRGVGIDPGVRPERVESRESVTWIRGMFPDDLPELDADAVVCRHTLEHIGPVREFLVAIREALVNRSTVLLFEVPDVRRVLDETAFWDVYYEHPAYFSAASLSRLFESCGFEVLRLERAYEGQTLVIEARPAQAAPRTSVEGGDEPADLRRAAVAFAARVDGVVTHWRERIGDVTGRGGRVVLWGGGSKAVAFLAALGGTAGHVDSVVDINPFKHDHYLPGSGHLVRAPKSLVELEPDLVVVMNGAYRAEIREELEHLGVHCAVEAL